MWVLRKTLAHLFPVFEIEKVLTVSKSGHLFLNGQIVTEQQKQSLQAAARMFRNTQLWEVLTSSLKSQAQKLAFNQSKDLQDLLNAKMILYTVDVQENILKKIEGAR